MEKNPVVAVVILDFHGEKDTLECLASLRNLQSSEAQVEVVLVKIDSETAGVDERFLRAYPHLHIVHTKNLGFSGGNNLGIRYAEQNLHPDFYMLLNNDTRVDPHLVTELFKAAQADSTSPAVYCPKIYFEKDREFHAASYTQEEKGKVIWYAGGLIDRDNVYASHRGVDEVDHGQFNKVEETGFGTGCCLLFTSKTWKRVGELNSRYFLYLEDLDYSLRVRKLGGRCMYIPTAVVWHKNAGSSGGSGSGTHVYYQTRNRLYLGMRFSRLNTKLALVKEAVKKLLHGTPEEKEAITDFLLLRMGARRGTTR